MLVETIRNASEIVLCEKFLNNYEINSRLPEWVIHAYLFEKIHLSTSFISGNISRFLYKKFPEIAMDFYYLNKKILEINLLNLKEHYNNVELDLMVSGIEAYKNYLLAL